jgi:holliday junction DNA helicase RuvA
MIAKLAGVIDHVGPEGAVIDVGGVGYLALCSTRTIGRLPAAGSTAALLIEMHVREDHIHLYGFIDDAERGWFRRLTTVPGVGTRLALAILSAVPPEQLGLAILAEDKAVLMRAEGVGARLATRIISELHGKVGEVGAPAASAAVIAAAPDADGGAAADAVSALVNLGYRRSEAFGAVATAARRLGSEADAGALIRAGLQELAR